MAGRRKESRAPTRRFHLPSAVRSSPARVEAERARQLMAAGATLVDVRRLDDPAVTLSGAVRIAPDELPQHLGELERHVPIVLACG
jgi:rhodanese-related sulfurtransferase